MIFKDREHAGQKLGELLKIHLKDIDGADIVVVSLLRGGVAVGAAVSNIFKSPHLPLPIAKVPARFHPEVALGAVCFDVTYLEKRVIHQFVEMKKSDIAKQITLARKKFNSYIKRFSVNKTLIKKEVKGKHVILVDDGIATGSTMRAAALYISTCSPKKITIAVPIILNEFFAPGIYTVALQVSRGATAISQFYRFFPQISDEEVKSIMKAD